MSACYNLVCTDCRITHWCGQSGSLYGGYEAKKTLQFLCSHRGHKLKFLLSEDEEFEDMHHGQGLEIFSEDPSEFPFTDKDTKYEKL